MRLLKNKKFLIYLFLFFFIGTFNNKNLNQLKTTKIKKINVIGLSKEENFKVANNLKFLKFDNLFFLDQIKIEKFIKENNYVEDLYIFKKYPSTLNIQIIKTNFLANINKDGKSFFIGSNGKLINNHNKKNKLPNIYGDFDIREFLRIKKTIDASDLNYENINDLFFFPSGRIDIKIKSGQLIKLPKNELKENLNLLILIFKNNNFKGIETIDLRQHGQVIING
tara:strand:+ start:1253 stop:1924 length:672 start_codon:yes stop_codon:yes gene_type:complete